MTVSVIIDSNLALASVLPEPITAQARSLLASLQHENIQLAAPLLFRYEIVAVMRKASIGCV